MGIGVHDGGGSGVPVTEGIKYAGSKLRLLPHIVRMLDGLPIRSALDGFSGTTRVSQVFARKGWDVLSNDVSDWSRVFATAYLLHDRPPEAYEPLLAHLNSLPGEYGWFSERYGGEPGCPGEKKPFQLRNTMKLDAVRAEISRLGLDAVTEAVALSSLILALDRVDSTLGHYASYLSSWSRRSYGELCLTVPRLVVSPGCHRVFCGDIFSLLPDVTADLAYYDPPYGSNNEKMPPSRVRYSAYYHLWTTVVRNDRPATFGKAFRREDSRDGVSGSVFESYSRNASGEWCAMAALRALIEQTRARYVLLSYSSGGRASKEALLDILSSSGRPVRSAEIDYRRNVMALMTWTQAWVQADTRHREYLFLVDKG